MNFSVLVETGYRALAGYTSYSTWKHFEELRKREWMASDELENFRKQQLKKVIFHAHERIPFYRNLWTSAGINPLKIESFVDFRELPIVTKADLIAAQEKDLFCLSCRNDYQLTHTSGTTGPCLYLPFTRQDLQFKYACYLREFYATGWRLGVPSAAIHYSGHPEFGGRYTGSPDRDNFVLTRQLAFRFAHRRKLLDPWSSQYYTGDEELPELWYQALRQHRPFLLESMDFNLMALYRYIRAYQLPPLRIPVIFVLATMDGGLKKRLEKFFGSRIFNRYGPHEIEGVAYECNHHEGLHVAADCVHAEVLDDNNQPVPDGVSGHLVLTDFDSRTMPLIRYRIGDVVRQTDRMCSCGRSFPLMADIDGRTCDRFESVDGQFIPASKVSSSLQALTELDLFQVCQDEQNRVEFLLPPADASRQASIEPMVKKVLRKVIGETVDLRFTAQKPLQLEWNGKFCFAKRVI